MPGVISGRGLFRVTESGLFAGSSWCWDTSAGRIRRTGLLCVASIPQGATFSVLSQLGRLTRFCRQVSEGKADEPTPGTLYHT